MKRLMLGLLLALTTVACTAPQPEPAPPPPPSDVEPTDEQMRGAPIQRNQVRTQHILNGAVTSGKLAIKQIAIQVNAAASTGTSAADPDLVGGHILGIRQTGNQDQHIDNVVLNGNGSITVTLAAAATANNNFTVAIMSIRGQY